MFLKLYAKFCSLESKYNVEITHNKLVTLENRTSMMAKAIMPVLKDLKSQINKTNKQLASQYRLMSSAHNRYNLLFRQMHEMQTIHHFALLLFKNYLTIQVGTLQRIHRQYIRYESALDDTLIGIENLNSGYLTHHILDPQVLTKYLEIIEDDLEDTAPEYEPVLRIPSTSTKANSISRTFPLLFTIKIPEEEQKIESMQLVVQVIMVMVCIIVACIVLYYCCKKFRHIHTLFKYCFPFLSISRILRTSCRTDLFMEVTNVTEGNTVWAHFMATGYFPTNIHLSRPIPKESVRIETCCCIFKQMILIGQTLKLQAYLVLELKCLMKQRY